MQDNNGNIVVDKLDEQRLIKLAASAGVYHRLTHDDRDIDYLLAAMKTGGSTREPRRPRSPATSGARRDPG